LTAQTGFKVGESLLQDIFFHRKQRSTKQIKRSFIAPPESTSFIKPHRGVQKRRGAEEYAATTLARRAALDLLKQSSADS
jgi:hypothetical protein